MPGPQSGLHMGQLCIKSYDGLQLGAVFLPNLKEGEERVTLTWALKDKFLFLGNCLSQLLLGM